MLKNNSSLGKLYYNDTNRPHIISNSANPIQNQWVSSLRSYEEPTHSNSKKILSTGRDRTKRYYTPVKNRVNVTIPERTGGKYTNDRALRRQWASDDQRSDNTDRRMRHRHNVDLDRVLQLRGAYSNSKDRNASLVRHISRSQESTTSKILSSEDIQKLRMGINSSNVTQKISKKFSSDMMNTHELASSNKVIGSGSSGENNIMHSSSPLWSSSNFVQNGNSPSYSSDKEHIEKEELQEMVEKLLDVNDSLRSIVKRLGSIINDATFCSNCVLKLPAEKREQANERRLLQLSPEQQQGKNIRMKIQDNSLHHLNLLSIPDNLVKETNSKLLGATYASHVKDESTNTDGDHIECTIEQENMHPAQHLSFSPVLSGQMSPGEVHFLRPANNQNGNNHHVSSIKSKEIDINREVNSAQSSILGSNNLSAVPNSSHHPEVPSLNLSIINKVTSGGWFSGNATQGETYSD